MRPHGDRGPADSHILERFSTTYSSSYRPFQEHAHRHVPIRCVSGSKDIGDGANLLNGSTSGTSSLSLRNPTTAIGSDSRAHNVTSVRTNDVSVPTAYVYPPPNNGTRGNLGSLLSTTDGTTGGTSTTTTMLGRQPRNEVGPINASEHQPTTRPKPPNMCVSGTSMHSSAHVGGGSIVSGAKLTPCYALGAYSSAIESDKIAQSGSSFKSSLCQTQPRTVSTIPSSVGFANKLDNQQFASNENHMAGSKRAGASGDRHLAVTPISPAYTFDFGQIFSQIARINSHLFLSSLSALSPEKLRHLGITLLVSAMIDTPPAQLRGAVSNCLHVSVEDMEGANLGIHFDRVVDRIASETRRGGRTLIHCMAGVSRSSTLIMAYLMRHLNMSLADAYQHVRSIRPCIQPNPSFWRQLLDYEERLRGSRSVRLLPPVGYLGSCGVTGPTGRMFAPERSMARTSYLDLYTRSSGDLLPYRPLTSVHSRDSAKPYLGYRQPLG